VEVEQRNKRQVKLRMMVLWRKVKSRDCFTRSGIKAVLSTHLFALHLRFTCASLARYLRTLTFSACIKPFANPPPSTSPTSSYTKTNTPPFKPHHHTTMAESADSNVTPTVMPASNSTPAGNNSTIATHTAPCVNTSVVRMTTDAASQVFNTAELLELILNKLEAKDVLVGASLVCRAFKTSIDSSPTINKTLESAVIDATPTALEWAGARYDYSRSLWLQSTPKRDICYLVMNFSVRSLDLHLSSLSFRKLRMPKLRPTITGFLSVNDRLHGLNETQRQLPYVHSESTITIAEQLEEIVSQTPQENPVTRVILPLLGGQRIKK
jgi:hypothetical protein